MESLLLDGLNLLLCMMWGWGAICRLALIHDGVMHRITAVYLALFIGAWFCGLQFFIFGTHAGGADIVASFLILGQLCGSFYRWRNGPPEDVITRPAKLTAMR